MEMTISKDREKMIDCSKGTRHDINYFMKVHAYAKTIGECGGLDEAARTAAEQKEYEKDLNAFQDQ